MIKQKIYLEEYYWDVDVYYAVSCYYTNEIVQALSDIGCNEKEIGEAEKLLRSCSLNTGLTYSDIDSHHTVIVIALTSSAAEFANSLVHEIAHLSQHIGEAFYLDPYSEEVCYLQGNLMRKMYPYCKKRLCEHCCTALVQHT